MTVAIISAIFGGYDVIKTPVEQSVDCTFTMVTDRKMDVPAWNVVAEAKSDMHPRLAAKLPKLRPWDYAPEADAWIWIDGAFQVVSETFAEEAVASAVADVSMWAHPWRDCLYQEAKASAEIPKYQTTPVLPQADHYRRMGFPGGAGLWATGLIVYRRRTDALADRWWSEMDRWGYQDQISLPVALATTRTSIGALPYGYMAGPWLRWYSHRSEL